MVDSTSWSLFRRKKKVTQTSVPPQYQPDVYNKDYQTGSGIAGTSSITTTTVDVGRTADTGGSGGGVGGTYDRTTGIFTDASGQGYSVAPEFVPFAKDITFTPNKDGGGGGGGQGLQSSLTNPTDPAGGGGGGDDGGGGNDGFTGQVEVFGTGGEAEQTLFYKDNKQVARFYKEEKTGETYAELGKGLKEARFTFPMSDVTFNLEGAEVSEYEYITGEKQPPSEDLGKPLSLGVYTQPTKEQLAESGFLSSYYGKSRAGNVLGTAIEPFRNLMGNIFVTLKGKQTENIENYGMIREETKGYSGMTSSYRLATMSDYAVKEKKATLGFLPEWNFEPETFARKQYSKGGDMLDIKTGAGILSFTSGLYKGVRENPLKTIGTAGLFVAIPPALRAGKYILKGTGFLKLASTYPKTSEFLGKGFQYGTGGLYTANVVSRVAATPGVEKWGTLGEITSTEIIPMGLGLKAGTYGVRRYELAAELKSWTAQLPSSKRIEFESELKQAKAYESFKPMVEEINLKRLKILEGKPEVQEKLIEYFREKKGSIIVGGSIGQETQVRNVATKRPGDIDIYVKKMFGEKMFAERYAMDIKNILKEGGLKNVRVSGAKVSVGGEKLVEFNPYKSYLKANIEQVSPWYKFADSGITETPSGIKVPKIQVQLQRKLIGGYLEQYTGTGKLRLKDIPAAKAIKNSIVKEFLSTNKIKLKWGNLKEHNLGVTKQKPNRFVGFNIPESISNFIVRSPLGRKAAIKFYNYKPIKIVINKELYGSPKTTRAVLQHEVIHAFRPEWTENQVREVVGRKEIVLAGLKSKEFPKWYLKQEWYGDVPLPKGLNKMELRENLKLKRKVKRETYTSFRTKESNIYLPKTSRTPKITMPTYIPYEPTTSYTPTKTKTTYPTPKIPPKTFIPTSPYSPRKDTYTFIGGGEPGVPYIPKIPTKSNKMVFGKIHNAPPRIPSLIRGERLFIPTTSFGTSLGKQIGLKISAVPSTGALARTGLVERKYRTSVLPTTILWKVKKGEFNL